MGEPITRQDDSKRELRRTNTEYVLMALAGFILGWTVHHLVGTYFSSWLSASLVLAIAWALLIVFWLQLN
jgi:p-aminobenzoyl-glutamate transporter AbgT